MSSYLSMFNKTIEETLDYLIRIFSANEQLYKTGELTKIKLAKEKFQLAKAYDPRKVLENFFQYVYQFKDDIMKRNEAFFLNENIKKHLSNDIMAGAQKVGISEDYIITKSIDIKNYWKILPQENRDKIWQYFQNMTTLCEKYVISSMSAK